MSEFVSDVRIPPPKYKKNVTNITNITKYNKKKTNFVFFCPNPSKAQIALKGGASS